MLTFVRPHHTVSVWMNMCERARASKEGGRKRSEIVRKCSLARLAHQQQTRRISQGRSISLLAQIQINEQFIPDCSLSLSLSIYLNSTCRQYWWHVFADKFFMVLFVIIYSGIIVVTLKYHRECCGKGEILPSVDTHVNLFNSCPKLRILSCIYGQQSLLFAFILYSQCLPSRFFSTTVLSLLNSLVHCGNSSNMISSLCTQRIHEQIKREQEKNSEEEEQWMNERLEMSQSILSTQINELCLLLFLSFLFSLSLSSCLLIWREAN